MDPPKRVACCAGMLRPGDLARERLADPLSAKLCVHENDKPVRLRFFRQPSAVRRQPRARFTSVNFQISGALVLFIATIGASLAGLFGNPQIIERSLFRPYWFLRRREYMSAFESGFMHADLGHLFFNMFTFYFFAFP